MSDTNAQFHFALARITTTQVLRSTGIDKARPSVIDSLTDLLVRYITLLGQRSRQSAESAGRHKCDLEDLRQACENIGAIPTTTRAGVREEDGVVQFITWCMSEEVANIRRIAGEGEDDMGESATANWLPGMYITSLSSISAFDFLANPSEMWLIECIDLVQKQIKATGDDKFHGTILDPQGQEAVISDSNKAQRVSIVIDGMNEVQETISIPDVVKEYINVR